MKIKVAVVGVGYLGRFHAQKYKTLESKYSGQVQLVGVCDLNKDQANLVASELGVQPFYSPEELVGKVDAVTIATVTSSHYSLAKYFLENNIHVNVEKPMTSTCKEGHELVRLAKEKNKLLSVGQSERFNPAYQSCLKMIKRPIYMELNRLAPYKSRGADVSVIHDLMIHDLDMVLSMDPTPYQVLMARGGKILSPTLDWASATLRFESGLNVHINSSRVSTQMIRNFRVYDGQSQLIADLQTGVVELARGENKEVHHQTIECGKGDNLLAETEAFLSAILQNKELVVSGDQGLRALEAVEAVQAMIDSQKGWA